MNVSWQDFVNVMSVFGPILLSLCVFIYFSDRRQNSATAIKANNTHDVVERMISALDNVTKLSAENKARIEETQRNLQHNQDQTRDRLHDMANFLSEYPQRPEMDRRIAESENRINGRVDRMEKSIMDDLREIKSDVKTIRDRG